MAKAQYKMLVIYALIGAIGLLAAVPVFAQSSSQQIGADRPTNSSTDSNAAASVDNRTLEKAARAYVKIQRIKQTEISETNGSERSDAAGQPRAEQTEAEELAAIKAEGLGPQQFDQILTMLDNDRNLHDRFMSYVNKNS